MVMPVRNNGNEQEGDRFQSFNWQIFATPTLYSYRVLLPSQFTVTILHTDPSWGIHPTCHVSKMTPRKDGLAKEQPDR